MRKSIFFWGLCILVLDQMTKLYVRDTITVGTSIPIINNFFHITHVSNTGIGFGLLKGLGPLIITATILILFGMLYYLNKIQDNVLMTLCFSLLLGGSIGNLIDRLVFGYVTDFLDFRIWPIFNVADSAVTIGGIILLFWLYKET